MHRIRHRPGLALAATAVVAALITTSCLHSARIPTEHAPGEELSAKLTPFSYFEEGPILFLAVDTRAAQYVDADESELFPVGIGLANRSQRSLTFTRESFVLEADGRRYPVASVEEYNRSYDRSRTDLRLAEPFVEGLAARFLAYRYSPLFLFPPRGGGGIVSNRFELGRNDWTQMVLYFPVPESELHGERFELLVDAEEVPETFVVGFEVK